MPFKRSTFVSRAHVALSVIAFACAFSGAAQAQTRSAPIVYKSDMALNAATYRTAQAPVAAAPKVRSAPADKATARIQFRYPDSASAGASVTPVSAPPADISPLRESAVTEIPQMVVPAKPVVEAASLQAMPEPAGQGVAYLPLNPVATPTAPARAEAGFSETGIAVIYGEEFAGLPTANGEVFSQMELTAAHPSLPLPSLVRVTSLDTGREVTVRVNDRGPFEDGANVQLSRKAAEALGMAGQGKGNVRLQYLSAAPVVAASPARSTAAVAPLMPAKPVEDMPAAAQLAPSPVSAEDELLGGSPAGAAPPRLMSMTVAPQKVNYAAASPAAGDVFVQLASFSDIGNAEALLRKVEPSLPVEIVPARVNGADFFRVRVGPFADQAAAEQVRAELYSAGTADGRIVAGY